MPLISLGLNHLTAPTALREQIAFAPADTAEAVADLARIPGVEEALILSTCNRTELYCNVAAGAEEQPAAWLYRHHRMTAGRLDEFLYRHQDDAAVRHLFRVATGLDSMVLGEPQVLGQVKDAWRTAHEAQALHAPLDRLLQHTFAVAKRVRTDTRIGTHPVSVAFTAVRLAEQMFTDLRRACVLLIGAGETVELAARHLADKRVKRLLVANRTVDNANALASRFGGLAVALSDLPQHLSEADIVITSTASRSPVLTRSMIEKTLRARRHRPMFLVDIAVPRDIEPAVAELDDVFLYGIDDLKAVIDDNLRSRESAAHDAEAIIELQVEHYMAWRRSLDLNGSIQTLRADAEAQRDQVLRKAQGMIDRGHSPGEAMDYLARTLTNKLLHGPSTRLRDAARKGDRELLDAAARLYDLDSRERR